MAFFNGIQAAQVAGHELMLVALVDLDFAEARTRLWSGDGIIEIDGYEWIGSGALGSISAIGFGENDAADKLTFSLSGVDAALVSLVRNSESVRGRDVTVYGQFLDATTGDALDRKFVVRQLVMDVLSYGAQGPSSRSISLTAETIWTARNLAAFAYWSDRDQKARFPGDRGCEFVATLKNKRLPWPTF